LGIAVVALDEAIEVKAFIVEGRITLKSR